MWFYPVVLSLQCDDNRRGAREDAAHGYSVRVGEGHRAVPTRLQTAHLKRHHRHREILKREYRAAILKPDCCIAAVSSRPTGIQISFLLMSAVISPNMLDLIPCDSASQISFREFQLGSILTDESGMNLPQSQIQSAARCGPR